MFVYAADALFKETCHACLGNVFAVSALPGIETCVMNSCVIMNVCVMRTVCCDLGAVRTQLVPGEPQQT